MPRAKTKRADGVSGQRGGAGAGAAVEERVGRPAVFTAADPVERAEVAEMQADALFEQLMAANAAPEPGTRRGTVVTRDAAAEIGLENADGTMSVPVVAASVESAGFTYVYDKRTGEPSKVNNNMLPQALKKLNPLTGELMFVGRPPRRADGRIVVPFQGKLKCRLHADDPDRETWDEMGFEVCDKDNLRTRHNVTRHMETRHKQEWKAIKERADELERDEQRLERRALLSAVTGGKVALGATAGASA